MRERNEESRATAATAVCICLAYTKYKVKKKRNIRQQTRENMTCKREGGISAAELELV